MGFEKPKVTIDLAEYQSLLKIKKEGNDDAALQLIKRLVEDEANEERISKYGFAKIFEILSGQFDVEYSKIRKEGKLEIVKISHKLD